MDNYRLILLLALGLILVSLWQAWQEDQRTRQPTPATAPTETATNSTALSGGAPALPGTSAAGSTIAVVKVESGQRIIVTTDMVHAEIDTLGGDLRGLRLLRHSVSVDRPDEPFPLLQESDKDFFIAQSDLIRPGTKCFADKIRYSAATTHYALGSGTNELRVPLSWRAPDGVRHVKTLVFHRGAYVIDVEYSIENRSAGDWNG